MKHVLARHWFLMMLVLVLATGIGFSSSLAPLLTVSWVRPAIIASVMFVMALPLQTTVFGDALRKPRAPILGVIANYGFVPLFAWLTVTVIGSTLTCSQDAIFGILVAATVPCTLASASVWTRRAGGNDAVSIIVTIVTNALCFLVTPAWLWVMLGAMPNFDPVVMVCKLGLLVVLPILAAQWLRRIERIGVWATKAKSALSASAQCGVLAMVFLGAIHTGKRLSGGDSPFWIEIVIVIVAVLAIHLASLFAGLRLAKLAGVSRGEAIAVAFAGSQKTLPVGLEVCAQLNVTILPIFAYHVGQLLVDTLIADRMRKHAEVG